MGGVTERPPRLHLSDYLWVLLGSLLAPGTAIILDLIGLVDTSTRVVGLAVAGLSASGAGAAWAYRHQVSAEKRRQQIE